MLVLVPAAVGIADLFRTLSADSATTFCFDCLDNSTSTTSPISSPTPTSTTSTSFNFLTPSAQSARCAH